MGQHSQGISVCLYRRHAGLRDREALWGGHAGLTPACASQEGWVTQFGVVDERRHSKPRLLTTPRRTCMHSDDEKSLSQFEQEPQAQLETKDFIIDLVVIVEPSTEYSTEVPP